MKIESIKETQTRGRLEMKNLGIWRGNTKASFNTRMQEMEEKTSGFEDMIEGMNKSDKEMLNLKNSWHKTYRNLGHHEKTKSQNNWNREKREESWVKDMHKGGAY